MKLIQNSLHMAEEEEEDEKGWEKLINNSY